MDAINYERLVEIADHHRVSFELLVRRAEQGATTTRALLGMPPAQWLTMKQTADAWDMRVHRLYQLTGMNDMIKLDYHGLRFRYRNENARSARGNGLFFHKQDVEAVGRMIRYGFKPRTALRIFEAKRLGVID